MKPDKLKLLDDAIELLSTVEDGQRVACQSWGCSGPDDPGDDCQVCQAVAKLQKLRRKLRKEPRPVEPDAIVLPADAQQQLRQGLPPLPRVGERRPRKARSRPRPSAQRPRSLLEMLPDQPIELTRIPRSQA